MSSFHIAREDWSLHRQGQLDQERHLEKVREALRQNLGELVSQEAIITSEGQRTIKVPIRSLNEYRFRYDLEQQEGAGSQGRGRAKGDVVSGATAGDGGPGAGDAPGVDYFEAEVSIDDLSQELFADLYLPHLDPKRNVDLTHQEYNWTDVRRHGLTANIDKKRTLLAALQRNALAGRPGSLHLRPEDLRYKSWEVTHRPQTAAAVLAMMDTSGSMGEFEKSVARTFFYWMVRFLRTRFERVEIAFLAHSTEAKEVSEEDFFTKGESGGTRVSSVYALALDLIRTRYPADRFNLYPVHFSDGDNLTSDNPLAVQLLRDLLAVSNQVGYGEVDAHHFAGAYYRSTTLYSLYEKEIQHPRFVSSLIRERGQVVDALKAFFGPERGASHAQLRS